MSRFLIHKGTAGKKIQCFTPEQVVFVPRICQKSIFEPTAGTKQNRQRLFSNYKKAFDLIDHGLLLKKLERYGLTERDLNLIKNYLSGRSQFVSIDGFQSVARKVTCGVPQGSVLGPLLFNVFINDLPAAIKHSIVDIYADDTTLSSSADIEVAPQAISENLQKDLEETRVWSIKNKMVLSDSKTKCMLVTGKRLESKFSDNCSLHLKTSR